MLINGRRNETSPCRGAGDDTLRAIARELVKAVRRSVTIDWAVKDSARATMRVMVKRLLRTYGYPPDKQEQAVQSKQAPSSSAAARPAASAASCAAPIQRARCLTARRAH